MNSDPFEKRLKELKEQNSQSIPPDTKLPDEPKSKIKDPFELRLEQKEKISENLFDGFTDILLSPEETPFEQGLGQAMRSIGPTLGGLPGDFISLAKGVLGTLPKLPNISPVKGVQDNFIKKQGRKVLEKVPTSEDLVKKFDELTENKYMPQSRKEEVLQEITSDMATLLLPAKTAGKAMKAMGAAIGSNLAKQGMAELGFGETAQSGAKLATMMGISMFNPNGVKKYVSGLYDKAMSVLPEGAEISGKNLHKSMTTLEQKLSKGIKTVESKKPVLDAIKELKKNIKDGKVKISDLLESKKNLNELRSAKIYDPEFKGTKEVRKSLKDNFSKLAKTLDDAVIEYGKDNPEFSKWYKEAQLGWGGIEQSKSASRFISRVMKKSNLGTHLAIQAVFNPSKAVIGIPVKVGLKSYELMHRIFKSPILRKYYINTVTEASKENLPAVSNNLKKLDKELLKEEKNIK